MVAEKWLFKILIKAENPALPCRPPPPVALPRVFPEIAETRPKTTEAYRILPKFTVCEARQGRLSSCKVQVQIYFPLFMQLVFIFTLIPGHGQWSERHTNYKLKKIEKYSGV